MDIGSNKIDIKMTSMYNKLWKKNSIVFIILIGDMPYLHEGCKLWNLRDIQTIWFHQLIVFVL